MDSSINEITEQVNEIYNKCVSDIDAEEKEFDEQISQLMEHKKRLSQKREAINSLKSEVFGLIEGIENIGEEYEAKLERKKDIDVEVSELETTLAERRKEITDIDATIEESNNLKKTQFQSLMDVVQRFGDGFLESDSEEEMASISESIAVEEEPEEEMEGEIEEEVDYLPELEKLEAALEDIDEVIFEDDEESAVEESEIEEQFEDVMDDVYIQDDEEDIDETGNAEQEENLTEEERLRRMIGDVTETDDNEEEEIQITLDTEDDLEGVSKLEKDALKKHSGQPKKKGLFGLRKRS